MARVQRSGCVFLSFPPSLSLYLSLLFPAFFLRSHSVTPAKLYNVALVLSAGQAWDLALLFPLKIMQFLSNAQNNKRESRAIKQHGY